MHYNEYVKYIKDETERQQRTLAKVEYLIKEEDMKTSESDSEDGKEDGHLQQAQHNVDNNHEQRENY